MSIFKVLREQRVEIIQTSHLAILKGLHNTWERCRQRGYKPEEPDFIASLVLDSVPFMYRVFHSLLSRYNFSVSIASVYCHQTPKVTFPNMMHQSCELGDILFVHVHRKQTGAVYRNALLYQAKMSSKQPYKVASAEEDQLRLYSEWPDFTYHHSGRLSGEKRNVKPKNPHPGAQYMLIDDRPPEEPESGLIGVPGTYPVGSCMPDIFLHDHNHLAQELYEFLVFRSGRPFEDLKTSKKTMGWSRVVWDLLHVGLHKAFNRKRSGRIGTPRISGEPVRQLDGFSFAETSSFYRQSTIQEVLGADRTHELFIDNGDVPPDFKSRDNYFDEEGSGVSVVLIESREGTQEREE